MSATRIAWALLAAAVVFAPSAFAGQVKFTFHDVTYSDGTRGELEVAVKDTKKNDYTTCTYFSDNYRTWLGQFARPVAIPGSQVKQWCLDHFHERFR